MTTDEKIDALRDEVRGLRAHQERIEALLAELLERLPRRESPADVLSLEEAARYVGVSKYTLRQGGAGTSVIPRYRDRPVQFLRSSLDRFKRERVEREAERMRRPAGRMSLVRRRSKAGGKKR